MPCMGDDAPPPSFHEPEYVYQRNESESNSKEILVRQDF